jgi:hypothetical protein
MYINNEFCVSNDNDLILTLFLRRSALVHRSLFLCMHACADVGVLYLVLLLQLIGDVEPVCWVRVRTLRLLDTEHSQLCRIKGILSYLGY